MSNKPPMLSSKPLMLEAVAFWWDEYVVADSEGNLDYEDALTAYIWSTGRRKSWAQRDLSISRVITYASRKGYRHTLKGDQLVIHGAALHPDYIARAAVDPA